MPSSQIIQTPHRRHVTHNERLRELGFVSVAKGRSRGNLIAAYNGLKSFWSTDRPKFTLEVAGIQQVVNITNYSLDASDLTNVINKIPGSSGTGCPAGWCNNDSWSFSRLSWTKTKFIRDSAGNGFDSRLLKPLPANFLWFNDKDYCPAHSHSPPARPQNYRNIKVRKIHQDHEVQPEMPHPTEVHQTGLNTDMFSSLHELTKLVLDGTRSGNILNKHICGKIWEHSYL